MAEGNNQLLVKENIWVTHVHLYIKLGQLCWRCMQVM